MKLSIKPIHLSLIVLLIFNGCVFKQLASNKFDIEYKDQGFTAEKYKNILIVPYIQYPATAWIDKPFQDSIFELCIKELDRKDFQIINMDDVRNYILQSQIDISEKVAHNIDNESLILDKLTSGNIIEKLGKHYNADTVVAIHVIRNTAGIYIFGGMEFDLEIFFYDAKDASVIWYGKANVVHGRAGSYKNRVVKKIFRNLFKHLE